MHHRRVLHAPPAAKGLSPLCPPTPAAAGAAVVEAVEPVEGAEAAAEVAPGTKGIVVPIHVHVVVVVMVAVVPKTIGRVIACAAGAEEYVKGVGTAEERGESGVGVAVEGVVVGAP